MGVPNDLFMQRYCLAWRANDYATVTDMWADDIVVHIPGRNPFSGVYRGKKEALDVSVRLQKAAPRYPTEIHDWLASDSHGVVLARERATRSGQTLEVDRIYVFHLQDGKVVELWIYHDDAAVDPFYS